MRSWRWPRATVPLVACLPPPTYRTEFRAPAPSPPATRAGRVERRADTRAQGPGGQAAGVARERAKAAAAAGEGRGGEAGVRRTSIWFQSMASQLPEPSISGEPRRWQRGGPCACACASHGVAWSRREGERERWGKIKRRKEMCSLVLFWSVRACPSVGFGLAWLAAEAT